MSQADSSQLNFVGNTVEAQQLGFNASSSVVTVTGDASQKMLQLVDATADAVELTLPPAASNPGKLYLVKKTDDGEEVVTVSCDGLDEIEGDASVDLNAQYDYLLLASDGVDQWLILSKTITAPSP